MKAPEAERGPGASPKWAPVSLASVVAATTEPDPAAAQRQEVDPSIGRLFGGKYRILDRLGAGGMAVVYRAQEQGMLTREVAIKLLTPESALSQATIARFLKEAQAISLIGHANVVQLIELGRTDEGQIYLVMERLLGRTLYEVLKDMGESGEVFTWDRLAPIVLQICRALHAAHKQRIIHRDIKPSNIFCSDLEDDHWHIKVLDFGIAKVQRSAGAADSIETPLTQEGSFIGTPHYAAPEIINMKPEHTIDGRVDIFALGVIMYQCLTGTLPFQDQHHDRLAVIYKTARERPQLPRERAPERDIPPEVEEIILRAMEIEVEQRYATVSELMEAIRATLRGGPGSTSRNVLKNGSLIETTPPPPSLADRAAPVVVPPAEPAPAVAPHPQPDSPTVQSPSRRAARGAIVALAMMFCGLVALVVIGVRDLAPVRPKHEPTAAAEPPRSAFAPPAKSEKEPASPVAIASEPPPRKRIIHDQLDKLAQSPAAIQCLTPASLGDGKFEELPVLLEVDSLGAGKPTIPPRLVEHRVPEKADACILAALTAARFAPGADTVKVSHTLRFD